MAPTESSTASPERTSTYLRPGAETDFSNATTPAMSTAPSIHKPDDVEKAPEPAADRTSNESGRGSAPPTRTIKGLKWFLICVSLFISAFLYGLDTTIAADVQGPIVEAFGHVDQLAWIGAGFPLGSIAVILLVGTLYGHFNMKWIYIASIALFEIGSVLCGAAPNMNALIVGRVLAGIGGAGIYLGCLNYFSLLTNPEERGLYISLIGFHWGIGAVLGPVVGGAFAVSAATWRWAFYINLVIGAAAAPVYVFFLPSIRPDEGKTVRERLVHFDFLGLALIAASWVLFTVGFSMAGGVWAWSDGRSIALVVVWGAVLVVTVLQQYFAVLTSAAYRAFPGHLIRSRTQVLLFVATAAATSALFVVVYYIPIYFQFVHSDSPIQAAVRLLPFIVVAVVTNVAAGHLLSKIRYYMPVYLLSGVLITISGALLMVFLDPATSESSIYGFSVLAAVGTGLTIQLGYAVGTLTTVPENIGHVINFQNVSQIGANVMCLVIAGQIFQSEALARLGAVLAGHGFTDTEITGAVAGAQSALFAQLEGELRRQAIGAIVGAMQKSFVLVVVAGGLMILAALGMKRERLFGQAVTA